MAQEVHVYVLWHGKCLIYIIDFWVFLLSYIFTLVLVDC